MTYFLRPQKMDRREVTYGKVTWDEEHSTILWRCLYKHRNDGGFIGKVLHGKTRRAVTKVRESLAHITCAVQRAVLP